MNITFIGNCQMVSLCFYFQQLLDENDNYICWIMFSDSFKKNLKKWSFKCKNKILDYNYSIKKIKESDVIIYQNISNKKSLFCNSNELNKLKKNNCKLVCIPSIRLDYIFFDNSIKELIARENKNNVDIKISEIFYKFKDFNLMLTLTHPKTFLFMEIIKKICKILNINFFTNDKYNTFMKDDNYMKLPV